MSMQADELYFQAIAELERGASENACDLVSQFSALEPNSQRTAILQAHLLEESGDLEGAERRLQEFTEKKLHSGVARGNLGRIQWRLGKQDKALSTLRLALTQEPNQERTLHFYASLLETAHGFPHAFNILLLLGNSPGAWLPAWVAAVLAGAKREGSLCVKALLQSAESAPRSFPPHPATLVNLLGTLDGRQRVDAWNSIRAYCDPRTQALGDSQFASVPEPREGTEGSSSKRGSIRGGTAAHAVLAPHPMLCLVTATRLIDPQTWQAEEIAGSLGRGLSLLLAEQLAFAQQIALEAVFDCVYQRGINYQRELPPVRDLLTLTSPDTQVLLSTYLSRNKTGEFTLDCERYDGKGNYLGHLTEKAAEPGACVAQMADRLGELLPSSELSLPPWSPSLTLDSLLARDTAAAFLLCEQGALDSRCLPNPGLSLDLLAEHAAEAQNPLDLLSYWNATCAAARLNMPQAAEQREIVAGLLHKDPQFEAFL